MAREEELERALRGLHAGPLREFAARRDALARELRARDPELAERVKAERKPSSSAWAVTQLLAHDERATAALLEAGRRAREALSAVLGGEDPGALRGRMDALQARIDEAKALAARALASETGREPGATVLDRVADDLRAIALSPEGEAVVARGRLAEDLASPGLEVWSAIPARPVRRRDRAPAARRATARPSARQGDARSKAERRAAEEAEASRAAERARAEAARVRAERAKAERAEAEARARAAREARARARALIREAEKAEREARDARARLEALAREVDRAERRARDARRRADEAASVARAAE